MKKIILLAGLLSTATAMAGPEINVRFSSSGRYLVTLTGPEEMCLTSPEYTVHPHSRKYSRRSGRIAVDAYVHSIVDVNADSPNESLKCHKAKPQAVGYFEIYGPTDLTIKIEDSAAERIFEGPIDIKTQKIRVQK